MNQEPAEFAELLGPDHEELGVVTALRVGPHCAIAISPGKYPKGYPSTAPNEDGVMASAVGDSTIVAVVDGHNGFAAAGAVLQAVRAALPDLHDASLDSGALLTATLAKAAAAIHGDSGCAAVLARIGPHRVEVCSRGDARALLVRGRRVRRLSRTSSFLGPGDDRGAADTTGVRVKSGDVLILGSDGLFDFLSGWHGAVKRSSRPGGSAGDSPKSHRVCLRRRCRRQHRRGSGSDSAQRPASPGRSRDLRYHVLSPPPQRGIH
jgi:serine/threonine protein phosphatase PrpC